MVKSHVNPKIVQYGLIAAGAGFVLYKFSGSFDKILQSLGLEKSQSTTNLDTAGANPASPWSPNFWKNAPAGALILTSAAANADAEQIYNSIGFLHYNPDSVKAVIKGLKTQSQVSFLADIYSQKYQKDLLSDIRGGYWNNRLSDDDVNALNDYVTKLPKYAA